MRFVRAHWMGGLAIWLLVVCASSPAQEATSKPRVAVLNFEDYSRRNAKLPQGINPGAEDTGKGVSAQLISKLVSGGKYTVVDRSAVKQLLEEQSNSELDGMDPYAKAARIGRLLALDAMIVGAITRFGPDDARAAASTSRTSVRKSKAYVDITARILSMTTAEVITEFTASGESDGSGNVVDVHAHGQSGTTQEILGSEFTDTLLGDATRHAVEKIADQLNAFAEKIPRLQMEIDGQVAEVAGDSITLNVGKKSGVRVGDRIEILREVRAQGESPQSASVPPVWQKVCEGTVTEVAELYATATFSGSGQVRVGDRVKRIADSKDAPH